MTFIASLKTKNGILQVSDSLELETGAISRYDDFRKLLNSKGIEEDNEEFKLTAKEIWETFKPERIKNKDGAKKTFKIFEYGSIQVAGSVIISGIEVSDIIQQLIKIITPKLPLTHLQIAEELMQILKPHFPDRESGAFDNPASESIASTDFIYSHYEPKTNEKFVHKLCYSQNHFTKNFTFIDQFEGREEWIYYPSGMVGLAYNFSSLNSSSIIFGELNFVNGFQILKHAVELSILTEKINYDIPGVGGTINFSIIDKHGFRFIKDINDLFED